MEKTARICLLGSVILLLVSCQSKPDQSSQGQSPTDELLSSTPPFLTKEPERYQALRTVTTNLSSGEAIVTRTLVAKDGRRRRDEYEMAGGRKLAYLDLPNGRFLLLADEKLYADLTNESRTEPGSQGWQDLPSESSPDRLLHTDPTQARYQLLGQELVNGTNSTKYRVVVNALSSPSVRKSETLIWFDEDLGMPIKSESTSADGTRSKMELSAVSRNVDQRLFSVPQDYEKVAPKALRRRLNSND